MMAGRYMQPAGGYPPGMTPQGAPLPTAAPPMRQPMYNMQVNASAETDRMYFTTLVCSCRYITIGKV